MISKDHYDLDIHVSSTESDNTHINIKEENGIYFIDISVKYDAPCIPSPITLTWRDKMIDIAATWYPICDRNHSVKHWIWPTKIPSNLYYGSPLLATVKYNGRNNTAVALSDTVKPAEMSFCVEDFEEKEEVRYQVVLLAHEVVESSEYHAQLRIDRRDVEFYEAIQDASAWMREVSGIKKYVPADAELPLYSTWYNFHQNPREELLRRELKAAADMGFKTVIIDDGWQFSGKGKGDYINCGDWAVTDEKFADFGKFIEYIHALSMKVMLWFPVPFAGYNTKDYQNFKDKLLYNDEVSKAGVYDVRYACVRRHIINTYVKFVDAYRLDGLKLDFVDSFKLLPESPKYNSEMDCKTVEGAVSTLLSEINEALKAKNSDFLIEFRQNYIGAEIVSYCNMLRILDCAYDSITNRLGIIDLRLAHTDTAIHADMLLWAREEKVQNCAKQLLNIMFGVPQISVLLTEIPNAQKELIAKFTAYWSEHRDLILHGNFKAYGVASNYTYASSENETEKITVLYSQNTYEFTGKNEDVFNNTDSETVCILNSKEKTLKMQIFDCNFKEILQFETSDSIIAVKIPIGGYCLII